jgi:hypothetical protein
MNRLTMMGISALTVAATAASAASVASAAGTTSAATARTTAGSRPAAVARCVPSHRNYAFPARPETFNALTGGSVTIAPVNRGTIRVAHVHAATGWHAYVDSGSGSSVDVYFRSGGHMIKFEAEINDAGGLTVTLTKCG